MFHKAVCVLQTAACFGKLYMFYECHVSWEHHAIRKALCVAKRHGLKLHGLFLALCVYKAPCSKAPWFVPCVLALCVYKAPWFVSCAFCLQSAMVCQRHIPFSRALCPHSSVLCFVLSSFFGAPRFVFKFHASFLGAMLPCWRLAPFLFFECPEYFLNCLVYFLGAPCFLFFFECFVAFLSATCVLECHVCSSALCVFLKCCAYFWVPRVFWCHVCSSMLRVFFTAARIF